MTPSVPCLRRVLVAGSLVATAFLSGCGTTGIAAAPLQRSITRTFANLYVLQQVDQGSPRPSLHLMATRAACLKGTPGTAQGGSGDDWVCDVTYFVDGIGVPVVAVYDVNVQTDGCYAADGDGPASLNGSRTIFDRHHRPVPNPLWLIDSCFDVT